MRHVTANSAQRDLDTVLDDVSRYNEPVTIVSDNNSVCVLISMDEWSSIQETLYLQSVPGMVDKIKAAAAEPLEDCVDASEVNFDV